MTAALSTHALSYAASDGKGLLSSVSLSVRQGDRLAIVGPNGAGKTTLLRLLAGILDPTDGAVEMLGHSLASLRPVERARLAAVVGQTDQPDGSVKVWDYVGLGRIPHSGARSRADEWSILRDALERTGLSHMRDRELGSLSGGERQRCQIARALAQEPKLLFLDEPTNHLDPRARHDLLALVAELEVTTVAVLHDLPLVPSFATRVAVMDNGRLAAFGSPADALSGAIVRSVFNLDVLRFPHPGHGRELTVFDLPQPRNSGASAQ